MSTKNYKQVRDLVGHIINARFGEMVEYSEQLIASEAWRNFTTPVGTRFVFRANEFDYFLAAENIDATTLRFAYIHAGSVTQQHHLADITGRGTPPKEGGRRPREEVAALYASAPGGAGDRIRAWAKETVVSDDVARVARNPERRRQREKSKNKEGKVTVGRCLRWEVRWVDGRPAAQAIVDKIAQDPELEHEVYKLLEAARKRNVRTKLKISARNSNGNGKLGARHA